VNNTKKDVIFFPGPIHGHDVSTNRGGVNTYMRCVGYRRGCQCLA
jgi:hypothetical protein